MTSHKWKKDRDGAESCEREGCTVRMFGVNMKHWQKQKGTRWHAVSLVSPLPPCAGKEAGDAKPAPSPLEVVREALETLRDQTGFRSTSHDALAAIATLEEFIRKDEREKCATFAHGAMMASTQWRTKVALADDVREAIRKRK